MAANWSHSTCPAETTTRFHPVRCFAFTELSCRRGCVLLSISPIVVLCLFFFGRFLIAVEQREKSVIGEDTALTTRSRSIYNAKKRAFARRSEMLMSCSNDLYLPSPSLSRQKRKRSCVSEESEPPRDIKTG